MRPRVALVLASLALLPAAGPLLADSGAPLARHSVGSDALQGWLDLAARTPEGFHATLPVLDDGATAKLLHVATPARAWDAWLVTGNASLLDLDGDGLAELRVALDTRADFRLHIDGLRAASQPWALWVDDGAGHWGLSGQGQPPRETSLELRDGAVRVAARGASPDLHAAFLGAPGHAQGVAWQLTSGSVTPVMLAEVGHGFALHALTADTTVRALLLDGPARVDLSLALAPAGATLERAADGALRYHAARAGGALRYSGDAAPIGLPGSLLLATQPLPPDFTLAPAEPGLRFDAAQPTDLDLDWQPDGGDALQLRARGTDSLVGVPGPAGLVLRGTGHVQAQQGAADASADLSNGQSVLLRAAGSPLLLAALLALGLGGWWVWRARKGRTPAA